MRRRDFLTLVGGATALPIAARAQKSGKTPDDPRISWLRFAWGPAGATPRFIAALGKWANIEGQNIK